MRFVAIAIICMIAVASAGEHAGQHHSGAHHTQQHKKPKHQRLFEADTCAMNAYTECKEALAPFLGSLTSILGAGDAINTCLQINECPVAQVAKHAMFNPMFLGDNIAEDLEIAGEYLMIDSQCEQDAAPILFLASNLMVDYKQIDNDIMDIIFMALFGEKAYSVCSMLLKPL